MNELRLLSDADARLIERRLQHGAAPEVVVGDLRRLLEDRRRRQEQMRQVGACLLSLAEHVQEIAARRQRLMPASVPTAAWLRDLAMQLRHLAGSEGLGKQG